MLVLRAMQSRDVKQLLAGEPWTDLCVKVTGQLAEVGQLGSTSQRRQSHVSC